MSFSGENFHAYALAKAVKACIYFVVSCAELCGFIMYCTNIYIFSVIIKVMNYVKYLDLLIKAVMINISALLLAYSYKQVLAMTAFSYIQLKHTEDKVVWK